MRPQCPPSGLVERDGAASAPPIPHHPLPGNMRGGERQAGAALLAELEALEPDLLRKRWRSLLRSPAPRGLTRPLLIRILAWREQILATGDLDKTALSVLESAMGPVSPEIVRAALGRGNLRPGMVLVREHGGVLHRIAVLPACGCAPSS